MKKLMGVLTVALLCAILMAQSASATIVLDFEDIDAAGVEGVQLQDGYAGFNWSDDAYALDKNYIPASGYFYGTQGQTCLATRSENTITMDNGGVFDFSGAYITSAWNTDHNFTVEGWLNDSMIYTSSKVTSSDKAYWFDFDYNNIDKLVFIPGSGTDAGTSGNGNHLCIDNITLVPEPLTLSLLGLGGLMLRRKRRA